MRWLLFTTMFLVACGHTELTTGQDAGASLASVTLPSTARDAGNGKWCAPEAQPCLHDGWQYSETSGYCCLSRQTCKGRDGGFGYCEY